MADVYALLRDSAPPLFATRKGNGWQLGERTPDIGPRGRKLAIFVLGENVLGLQATIPARNEREAARAAPFAVEDEIAEPVETSHVALGPKPEDPTQARRVYVVSNAQMAAWVDRLGELGWDDADIIAAHTVLPEGNHLFDAGEIVLGRLGPRTFALEAGIGSDVFLGLMDGHETVSIHGAALASRLSRASEGHGADSDEALLVQLANWASARAPIGLRQGSYEPRRRIDMGGIGQWRLVGVLAAAVAIAWLGMTLTQTAMTKARVAELDRRIDEFVTVGWPEANGDRQVVMSEIGQQNLATDRAQPSALTAIAVLYKAIETVPDSQLRSLRYDRSRNQLTAIMLFDGFGGSDSLVNSITQQGLNARAGDARQNGDQVVAEISVELS